MAEAYSSTHLSFVLLLLLPLNCWAADKPDIEGNALVEILTALNDSNHRMRDWDIGFVSPCFSWSNVTCSNGRVVSLSLASKGFTGTLSPSIAKLKFLVSLDLQDNNLTGALPDSVSNLLNLQNLNLAHNNLNGSIPTSWGQLSNLKHLVVRGNHLSGSIPESLANISDLMEFFTATHLICGNNLRQPCVSSSSIPVSKRKSKVQVLVTVASIGAFSLLLLGAVFGYRFHRIHKLKDDVFVDVAGEDERKISFGQIKRFSFREVQLATDSFSEGNIIGQGGYGKVYRGILADNTRVAVKRLMDYHSPGGEAAFLREVHLISIAVHKNLLRLIGFCTTSTERILVYPFMQNLSVAYRLRGEEGLDWPARKRIAFGTAHGLEYLHEHCNPKIIHRDMKAANILLNDEFEPVLGDFGLAKLVDAKATHVTTQVRGTMGHIAPEYLSTGKSSEKTDVFGYGITLLELVTGQRAIDFSRLEEEEDVLLLDHLLREKRLEDIVDEHLKSYDRKEVEMILQVAMLCTQSSPEERPKMADVVSMLQGIGLAERWAEWEQLEQVRIQEFSVMSHKFIWAEDSTLDQEAIQLSQAR
ncbi:hypothetical protein DH2020_012617 [Rehmannia glutinosa]|uniref:non-specific serine/threonine protein kinase n=1 Tax=Rehmannia glutinosa TaxID=99300 RepID=A0ABR0WZW3_REHGL